MSIQDEAYQVVAAIVKNYQPQKVILYGSVAKGEEKADSDIDLLIIKNTNKRKPFRIKDVFTSIRGLNRNFALDPKVYTPEELIQRQSMGDYFVNEALQGKVMYET